MSLLEVAFVVVCSVVLIQAGLLLLLYWGLIDTRAQVTHLSETFTSYAEANGVILAALVNGHDVRQIFEDHNALSKDVN